MLFMTVVLNYNIPYNYYLFIFASEK